MTEEEVINARPLLSRLAALQKIKQQMESGFDQVIVTGMNGGFKTLLYEGKTNPAAREAFHDGLPEMILNATYMAVSYQIAGIKGRLREMGVTGEVLGAP